ncbi:MAG: helix-turn-helix domain-containing protein [Actinomycetia bacterium]|nr:helix-turn-helix domain-containing protein [Actinomycetes bacterium]
MPETLGSMLREERKQRGLTTYDVSAATRIMQSSIQAIEDDDYERLPAPGYIRGYILGYCRFLQLDPQPFLRQFELDTGNARQNAIEDLTINHTAVQKYTEQHDIPWRTAIIIALVLLVIVVGVFLLLSSRNQGAGQNVPVPPEATSTAPTGAKKAPFTFTVQAKNGMASACKVVCDGVTTYDAVLTSGMKQSFSAQSKATVTMANPSALTVTRDGKALGTGKAAPTTLTLGAKTK